MLVVGGFIVIVRFIILTHFSSNFALAILAKMDNHNVGCFSFSEFYALLQPCDITLEREFEEVMPIVFC